MILSKLNSLIKSSFLATSSLILLLATPLSAFAEDAPAAVVAPPACVAPTSADPGNRAPSGAAALTYVYDCNSGLWENDHYTYNPNTQMYIAKDSVVYTYNQATGVYDYSTWEYSPVRSAYYQLAATAAQPPLGAQTIGQPVPVVIPNTPDAGQSQSVSGEQNGTNNNGSVAASNLNATANTTINNTTGVSLINNLYGRTVTGNALVIGNTSAGNATSGNAQDIANIVNMLQSSSNAFANNGLVTFVANIDGNVNGDLLLDPAQLSAVQNASNVNLNDKTIINTSTNASINNNLNLLSGTGNATVSKNTAGGDATTGNATAIVNLVNVINSAITAGKSFIGVVNINGNLNGDILLPPNFVDQLIAANVPTVTITAPSSVNNNNTNITDTTKVNNTNNLGINNNVTATADSGAATVSNNTAAGNATTGNATTKITAFNLTGNSVVGTNNLLVFVNVLGTWVGLIVNAPAGSTAADLGGGVTQNNTNIASDTTINNKVKESINNTVNVAAKTGDATVSSNTQGGNAKTGDAKAAVNILNIENARLAFSNWFGLLFINVFGNWHGSFGVNTSAGDPVVVASERSDSTSSTGTQSSSPQVFRFVPKFSSTVSTPSNEAFNIAPVADSVLPTRLADAAVLTASTKKQQASTPQLQATKNSLWRAASIIGAVVVLYIVADALLSRYRAGRRA